ncbi:MAG: hypothetical protein ED556_11300 [Winogradskyella sp.]|uniref:carboxypeptidase-like regulatory domain-containing protein n=1 Tax=Winogradskyella sp. TaxID=1883156 RepID=UPI000F40D944|nr:carboxypeptidase-like regulatory domain-containing protein [Winogradskyella sp.]RNC85143.1 MAG: hypothetical protein ED556_11300 [Winogradskyella sp.]
MNRATHIISVIGFFLSLSAYSQLKLLKGSVFANDDVEGIHILNKTSAKYTVTNAEGNFEILAKEKDVLTITSLKYETLEVIVTSKNMNDQSLKMYLIERVNELEEVVVGKILTGNIGSDIGNIDLEKELNFYDLGIPGYTGKPKTLNERKLADADGGAPIYYGMGVNFHKLLNRISGRTKRLKQRVDLDERIKCLVEIKELYSESLFENEEFTTGQINDYFYFCMDAENFKTICQRNDPTEIIPFLEEKLKTYKENLNSKED